MASILRYPVVFVRSALIGTGIGILRGVGAAIGATVSYILSRLSSAAPERFGKGVEEGVIASETGNNASR